LMGRSEGKREVGWRVGCKRTYRSFRDYPY
jgi:hypothetical protein